MATDESALPTLLNAETGTLLLNDCFEPSHSLRCRLSSHISDSIILKELSYSLMGVKLVLYFTPPNNI